MSNPPEPRVLRLAKLTLNLSNGRLLQDGELCGTLSSRERDMLGLLVERTGTWVTRATLYREVWGYSENSKSRTLDTTLCRLRAKLKKAGITKDIVASSKEQSFCFVPLGLEPPGSFPEGSLLLPTQRWTSLLGADEEALNTKLWQICWQSSCPRQWVDLEGLQSEMDLDTRLAWTLQSDTLSGAGGAHSWLFVSSPGLFHSQLGERLNRWLAQNPNKQILVAAGRPFEYGAESCVTLHAPPSDGSALQERGKAELSPEALLLYRWALNLGEPFGLQQAEVFLEHVNSSIVVETLLFLIQKGLLTPNSSSNGKRLFRATGPSLDWSAPGCFAWNREPSR